MTRVLMIAPTPFFSDRGCHVRIYEEARYLGRHGFEVLVLTYPLGDDPPEIKVRRAAPLAGYSRLEAGPAWPRLLLDLRVLREGLQVCKSFRPALLHAHLHEGALIGAILRARFKLPLLFDYQGSLTEESIQHGFIRESGFLAAIFRAVEKRLDRAPDQVIVSAHALSASPRRCRAVEAAPDGVDVERFSPGPADPALGRELGLPADRPLIVYLGVLSRYQGTDLVLHAARLLRDRGVQAHFLVMGYPEAEWKAMAASLRLEDAVTFTGRLPYFRAPEFLRLGAVALAPKLARTEGNGKVLDYMACGLPVVAFDSPLNRELLGEAAQWVTSSDDRDECAQRLAAAIAKVLGDPARAAMLGQAGRNRAVSGFAIELQGEKLVAIYRRLLEGRS